MEKYNDFRAALDNMSIEPDFPKLQSMLNFIAKLLSSLTFSVQANEISVNFDDDSIECLFYEFFETRDIAENKEKLLLLISKIKEIVSKKSYRYN